MQQDLRHSKKIGKGEGGGGGAPHADPHMIDM